MIKNYTSNVPPGRSVAFIEALLVSHGARNVMKEYSAIGKIEAITFIVPTNGREIPFRFSAKTSQVIKTLKERIKRPRRETIKRIEEQADRTAWKILSDSIELQLTLVDLGQKELLEVFLSDAYDFKSKQTFFDKVKDGQIRLLMEKN